jgi:hypothetical protein
MYAKISKKRKISNISKKTAGTFLHRQFFVAPTFGAKGTR